MNRRFQGGFPGNGPRASIQPDMSQGEYLRRDFENNDIPFEDVIRLLDAKNLPPQIRQTPYSTMFTASNQTVLLIPSNPNRMSFTVAIIDTNSIPSQDLVMFSYGPPVPGFQVNNIGFGVPIAVNSSFSEGNGTVSIDDIYVIVGNLTHNLLVVGYEGLLAIESHSHNQTGNI